MANTAPNIFSHGALIPSAQPAGNVTINDSAGITKLSIQWISGTITVLTGGNLDGLASSAITMDATVNSISIQTEQSMDGVIIGGSGICVVIAS